MNEQELTVHRASRYDRYMSESATGTPESEKTELLDQELLAKWEPYLKEADNILRDAIIDRIKKKQEPDPDLANHPEKLHAIEKEEVDRRYNEMRSQFEVKRPEDLYKVDAILNNYMHQTENAKKLLGDDSEAPGEVLWKNEDLWEKFGWSKTEKENVERKLMEVFGGLFDRLKLDHKHKEKRIEIIMEIMLSQGRKPADVLNDLIAGRDEVMNNWKDESKVDTDAKREYKRNPDIYFMHQLGIEDIHIKHFILPEYYKQENDQALYYSISGPKDVEDLAWNIMYTPGKGLAGWGVKGEAPLLEMRIEAERDDHGREKKVDGKFVVDKIKSRYRVNTANMVRWARYTMYQEYDRDREDAKDFLQLISIQGSRPLSFNQMLLNPKQFFRSEDGISYNGLMGQIYKEAAVFSTVRSWDVAYRMVAGDPTELKKVFKQIYDTKNLLTRGALGSNIMGLMTTMPLNFEGLKNGKWESDNVMGAAWIDIYRAYDSLCDYENLKKILGDGSKFFTQKGWAQAIQEVAFESLGVTGVSNFKVFFGIDNYRFFERAFDENGEISTIENRRNFIQFINIFSNKMPNSNLEFTVRAALRGAIAEKYGKEAYIKYNIKGTDKKGIITENGKPDGKPVIQHAFVTSETGKNSDKIEDREADTDSLKLAEGIAWSLCRPFGATAKNDPDAVGHDWMARVYNTQMMRQKYPHRGDKFGFEWNVMQFKRTGWDIMNGIVTEGPAPILDEEGKPVLDKHGMPVYRKRTPMEIFIQLSEFKTAAAKKQKLLEKELKEINPNDTEAIRKKIKEIEDHEKISNQKYQNIAQNVSFSQRALSNYWEDHLQHGIDLAQQLSSAEGIDWQKVTSYDVWGGVRLNQAEFQKEVQDKWIHKIRYMIETYPSINLDQKVRVIDQTATHERHYREHPHRPMEPVYHEVTMGEAMFGHQMLNRPKFWKIGENGKPINLRDQKGRKMKGLYEIDWQKVQNDKQAVWKQWFMMGVAGELFNHRALHGKEQRMNFTFYQNAIEALARLPGDLFQDEYNFKHSVTTKPFFDKADLAWLRRMANITTFSLYTTAMIKDVFMEDKPEEGIGLLAALSLAMKAIIEQKV